MDATNQNQQQTAPQWHRTRSPHPSIEDARKFREELNSTPTPPPVQAPLVPNLPPVQMTPPEPAPQPAPQPSAHLEDPAKMQLPKEFFTNPVQPPQPQPQFDDSKYRNEIEDLRRQLAETNKALEESRSAVSKYRQMEEDHYIDSYLNNEDNQFTTIDKEDARKLLKPLYKGMREDFDRRSQRESARIDEIKSEFDKQIADMKQREENQRREYTRQRILKAVPDLEELQKKPEYSRAMMSPISANSSILLGNVVASEFMKGNADYIIDVLNKIKGTPEPTLDSQASVSFSSSATKPAAPNNDTELSLERLEQMKVDVQTGRMSRSQFRELLRKYRGASDATQKS